MKRDRQNDKKTSKGRQVKRENETGKSQKKTDEERQIKERYIIADKER